MMIERKCCSFSLNKVYVARNYVMDMDSGNGKNRVKSDERLFRIIELLQERDGAGVTELADEMDLAKSTVYNHLSTLTDFGYAWNDGEKYHIGLRFLTHGIFAREQKIIYKMARSRIDTLAEETNELSWCQTHENGKVVYLYGATGEHALDPFERIGNRSYMHKLAGGKAMLAYLPETEVRNIVDQNGLPEATPNTITNLEELLDELRTIKQQRIAYNREESVENVNSLATPVLGSDNEVLGAIGITGPKNRLKGERFEEELPDLLRGTANEIEVKIAHREFGPF